MAKLSVFLVVTLISYVYGVKDTDFCSGDYIKFLKCVRKYGDEKTKSTINDCLARVAPDGNEKKFYKAACQGDRIAAIFRRCTYEKIKEYGTIVYPHKCGKLIPHTAAEIGKHVQDYFCSNPERYMCLRKLAPYEDQKYFDTCRQKLFPELAETEFVKFVCSFNDTLNYKRLGDLKTCLINHLRNIGRLEPPKYFTECQALSKSMAIQKWLCANTTDNRYRCLMNALPVNVKIDAVNCTNEYVGDADVMPQIFCGNNEKTLLDIAKWTSCIIHILHNKLKGSAHIYISKCK